MTFLDPIAGLIAAAIGVPILIALYLLKLRRKPLRVSSTLLWDQAAQDLQANVPLRWLRKSWLLLVQLLALLALCTALARPTIPSLTAAPPAARTILIIDHSASMSATDTPPTRLAQAKADALQTIDQLTQSTSTTRPEAMVIALAAQPRALTGFTSDPRELRDAVESIQPTDEPANVEAALALVRATALADNTESARSPHTAVLFFSDGDLSLPGGAPPPELPASAELRLIRAGPPPTTQPDNLGIVALTVRRDAQTPTTARVFARIQNASPHAVQTLVQCQADPAEPAKLATLDIPPAGEASVTFALDQPTAGLITLWLDRPDQLSSDNKATADLSAPKRPRVLLVGPGGADPRRGPAGVDRFLLRALEELDLTDVRTLSDAEYAQLAHPAADLIIFDRVTPKTVPGVPTLSFGAGLPIKGLTVDPPAAGAAPTKFTLWQRTHPLLRYAPLDAVVIAPAMKMQIAENAEITPIAFGASDEPLLAVTHGPTPFSPKHVLVAFDLLQSNWGADVSFPIFIASSVEWLTGQGDAAAGRAFSTAEPAKIAVDAVDSPRQVRIQGPGSFSRTIDLPATHEPVASLGVLPLTGVYQVTPLPTGKTGRVCVNLVNAEESRLASRDKLAFSALVGAARVSAGNGKARQEIWAWFVLVAVGLLCVEWVLYAWQARV